MPAKKYRVAVIGRTGKGNYGHGLDTCWLKVPNVEIVAVSDDDETGRAAAVKRLKAPQAYADYRQMLDKEKPDIAAIFPRWPDVHPEMVLACADRGIHMFCEKPLARTLAEADVMVEACERKHVKCAIAHQTRYSPRVKIVKEMITSGQLGDIVELRGNGKEDARGGGEDMMVLGTHIFDLMRHFAGDARWCFARCNVEGRKALIAEAREAREPIGPILGDHVTAQYGFDGLTLGTFFTHKAKAGAGKRYSLEIRGTKGQVQMGFGVFGPTYYSDDVSWMHGQTKTAWQPITSNGLNKPETLDTKAIDNGNIWIVNDLIDAIEKDRLPLDGVHDGRAALEMILAVYESHRQDKAVELPLKNRNHPLAKA